MSAPVAIIGGGIIGSACAGRLAQLGFETILVQGKQRHQRPALSSDAWDSRAYALNQQACSVLKDLGAAEHIRRKGVFESLRVWDDSDRLLQFHATDIGVSQLGIVVEHTVLADALAERLQALPNLQCIEKEFNKIHFPERSKQPLSLQFDDGDTCDVSFVIGADGAKSIVRECAGIASKCRPYHQVAHAAVVATQQPHRNICWQKFSSSQGVLALLPLTDKVCSAIWSHPQDVDPTQFETVFSQAMGLGDITLLSQPASFPLQGMLAEKYVTRHCALIGDAAHNVHPLAGQGANLGFRDIACLLDALQKSQPQQFKWSVLRRYQRTVVLHNAAVKTGIELLLKLGQAPPHSNPLLWKTICNSMGRSAWLRGFFIQRASGAV